MMDRVQVYWRVGPCVRRQARRGSAWSLVAAGLMNIVNVTTPTITQSMLVM